jgi:lipopolysaccharide biosynthesis glycosyltransferase
MKVFIGYDFKEDTAYRVCEYSIKKNSSIMLDVEALNQQALRKSNLYWRESDPLSSTEFTFTRFLVPAIMKYQGWALFCDSDFLWVDDVNKLFSQIDNRYAVMVVQHNYAPKSTTKKNNHPQYIYPKKNWSSMILWNCGHKKNKMLSPELVNTSSGEFLHRFMWLDDNDIGNIDKSWNYLVNWYHHGNPSAIHFTEGGPWLTKYKNCEYSVEWNHYNNARLLNK